MAALVTLLLVTLVAAWAAWLVWNGSKVGAIVGLATAAPRSRVLDWLHLAGAMGPQPRQARTASPGLEVPLLAGRSILVTTGPGNRAAGPLTWVSYMPTDRRADCRCMRDAPRPRRRSRRRGFENNSARSVGATHQRETTASPHS